MPKNTGKDALMPADLVLFNGRIITLNSAQPVAEAIAVIKDKIAHVGTDIEVKAWIGKDTKTIDLDRKTVIPGFIDSHIHVSDFASVLSWIDLSDVNSISALQTLIQSSVTRTPKGKWIVGRGWEQNSFVEKRIPTRSDLDMVSKDNPVLLYQKYGQMCIANSKALELAGLTEQTAVCAVGMDRDPKTGALTGILRDNATSAVWKFVPALNEGELTEAVVLACERIVKSGITGVCWIISSATELSIIEKLNAQHRLPLSICVIIPVELLDASLSSPLMNAALDSAVKIGGVMLFADGYLASRSAAMYQAYSDSTISGKLLYTQQELNQLAEKIQKANLQLIIHAAGDKAVDAALTAIEAANNEMGEKAQCARLEQAAVLNQGIVARIRKDNVIVSVQPCVIESEHKVYSAEKCLGPSRLEWLYPLRTLVDLEIKVIGGSDCPMEPLNPLLGIQAVVTRDFVSKQQVTIQQALKLYTANAAYATLEEKIKGSIEVGKFADLAVLSSDLLTAKPEEIGKIKVEMTVVKGKIF